MGCCESIIRVVLGSKLSSDGKGDVELGGASSKPFTMHSTLKGKDVVLQGGSVSGTGLALGCAPVEQVKRGGCRYGWCAAYAWRVVRVPSLHACVGGRGKVGKSATRHTKCTTRQAAEEQTHTEELTHTGMYPHSRWPCVAAVHLCISAEQNRGVSRLRTGCICVHRNHFTSVSVER